LYIKVKTIAKVINNILKFNTKKKIKAIWITKEKSVKEDKDKNNTRLAYDKASAGFEL
jgi:hypothetical protein